ncbi:P-loop containing nucleoside triphosphate hydrolase protein [Apodospora peruviana]|uniref:P-loop containing nucleoside triphosphate hydrolase protein n=1 Tax=Apodospora peruviana TaxID=516989 RepID=A0AAE0I108_9PEZI|nr:P-loop containing nucleoside triphosphate hydrolase protein [Apodospora peruviana]
MPRSHDERLEEDGLDDSQPHRHQSFSFPSLESDFTISSELRNCVVKPGISTNTTFDDINITQPTLEALDFLAMSLLNPPGYNFGVLSRSNTPRVLLYGPPGTGMSLLVKTLAKHTNSTLITLTEADIQSTDISNSRHTIQRLFAYAGRNQPILEAVHACYISQFPIELDKIKSDQTPSPLVIASTNKPYDIDESILRRLITRIVVDLPDATGREHILGIHLRDEPLSKEVDLSELARNTPDYTGLDLAELVAAAAARHAERDNIKRAVFSVGLGWHHPSIHVFHHNNSGAHGKGVSKPPYQTVRSSSGTTTQRQPKNDSTWAVAGLGQAQRMITRAHLFRARAGIYPTFLADTVARIREFDAKYGNASFRGRPGLFSSTSR